MKKTNLKKWRTKETCRFRKVPRLVDLLKIIRFAT